MLFNSALIHSRLRGIATVIAHASGDPPRALLVRLKQVSLPNCLVPYLYWRYCPCVSLPISHCPPQTTWGSWSFRIALIFIHAAGTNLAGSHDPRDILDAFSSAVPCKQRCT